MSADRELRLTRLIDAPREKVYRAWTDAGLLKQWFAPLPYTTPVAELDVRPGGSAFIVMREGQQVKPDELREVCRAHGLPQFKIPREITFTQELPRSPTGKVLKRQLTEKANATA